MVHRRMEMRVDQAGQNEMTGGIDHLRSGIVRQRPGGCDGFDNLPSDQYVSLLGVRPAGCKGAQKRIAEQGFHCTCSVGGEA